MEKSSFPYGYWAKIMGLFLFVLSIANFFYQRYRKGIFDLNELALGICYAFLFIFFSKEKEDDEMIHQLKFKALARSVIITFMTTHLYNYIFLNWRYDR